MKKAFFVFAILYFNAIQAQAPFDSNSVIKFQNDLNIEFSDPKHSPLNKEDLAKFKALEFYSIDEKFCVKAVLKRTPNEVPFLMKTTTDRKPLYVKYGEVSFTIENQSFTLNVYQDVEYSKKQGNEDDLFLPFFDLTCGKESYIGGRYIDLKVPNSNELLIDFNKAYNPYCAYSHRYSCPKVPIENDLNIAIKAGVKRFKD